MVNSGAIMSAALLLYMVKPEMSVSEKFEYVQQFFTRMAGGEHVGFQNSVFLSERDTADREAFSIYNQINILLPIRI
jgi:glutaminase